MDKKAFRALSYGVYIIAAEGPDGKKAGCVVNTFAQVTGSPAQATVAINKDNATCAVVAAAGRFTASVLTENVDMALVGTFGYKTSAEVDKFEGVDYGVDAYGQPFIQAGANACFSVKITNAIDVGSHMLFIGAVEDAAVLSADPSMTYAYYHLVKGGKTPPKASSYNGEEEAQQPAPALEKKTGWRCTICGHIEYVDELPDDFACPVCGKGKAVFESFEG